MPKILVVEDSKEMLSNISMLLKMNGYEVFEAEDGVSGFETAKKQLPDVIVSDIMMPVADGLRLLQEVRREPDLITTPFIFLTAKVDRRDVRTGMVSGADDYVSKPFKSKELIEAIETQLKKKYTKDKKFQEIYKTISSYIPHELRTPLVAIFGYTNFLLEDYEHLEKDDVMEMLKNIKTASSRLYKTIEKYLRFNDAELMVANKKGTIAQSRLQNLIFELDAIPEKVEKLLNSNSQIIEIAKKFKDVRNFLYLGRGYNFPVALEGALKLKEISYIHAEGYPAAEMKHGPIALIDQHMPVVFIATNRGTYDKVQSNIMEVKARQGQVISIVTEGDTQVKKISDIVIEIPECDELLVPLLAIIPLQLLSYHIAVMRGCNVDQPRNLAKSVTVE